MRVQGLGFSLGCRVQRHRAREEEEEELGKALWPRRHADQALGLGFRA